MDILRVRTVKKQEGMEPASLMTDQEDAAMARRVELVMQLLGPSF